MDPDANDEPVRSAVEKTEEQQRRLVEAVKNVFVFKNLDPEARTQVLNVMFERKVLTGSL